MGVKVTFNGMMFYFKDECDFFELLDLNCDYVEEDRINPEGIRYENED